MHVNKVLSSSKVKLLEKPYESKVSSVVIYCF